MKKILLYFVFLVYVFGADATIHIINENKPIPKIILQGFHDESVQDGDNFFELMKNDLKVTADFEILSTSKISDINEALPSDSVLVFRYFLSKNNNTLQLKTFLYSSDKNLEFKKDYFLTNNDEWVFLAHKSIIDLVNHLNLSSVDWMQKKIIFAKYISPKSTQINVADYSLTYQKTVVDGKLNIFPKWANEKQDSFYYTSFVKNEPVLFKFDLDTNKKEKIIKGNGLLIASDVSKNGEKILLTMSPKDQPDIFLYNLKNKSLTQITDYKGIDVNGNFIDNDTRIAFVSDRLGYPNIFASNIIGAKNIEQLVFHNKNNNSISTYQNLITYSSREVDDLDGNSFNIYLASTNKNFVKQLTSSGKNFYPRFSSDGGSILFIKQDASKSFLNIIRLNENLSFSFALKIGKLQSIDW